MQHHLDSDDAKAEKLLIQLLKHADAIVHKLRLAEATRKQKLEQEFGEWFSSGEAGGS